MCIEREKVDFKSREVNCLKKCALALREKEEISLSAMTKAPKATEKFEKQNNNTKHKNATKAPFTCPDLHRVCKLYIYV